MNETEKRTKSSFFLLIVWSICKLIVFIYLWILANTIIHELGHLLVIGIYYLYYYQDIICGNKKNFSIIKRNKVFSTVFSEVIFGKGRELYSTSLGSHFVISFCSIPFGAYTRYNTNLEKTSLLWKIAIPTSGFIIQSFFLFLNFLFIKKKINRSRKYYNFFYYLPFMTFIVTFIVMWIPGYGDFYEMIFC